MILSGNQFLDSTKLNALVYDQSLRYQQQLPLRFIDRLPSVDADDDEIIATFSGQVFAADIIADDQPAAVYSAGAMEFVTNVIPNLKLGRRISQSLLQRLNRIKANVGTPGDRATFNSWEVTTAQALLRGVREQMNFLACAMMLDSLVYDRHGIKVNGSWGTPSAYKVTPSVLWTSTSATPVTDVLAAKEYAQNNQGQTFNRMTLPQADFLNMAKTTEFQALINGQPAVMAALSSGAFNTRDPRMKAFAQDILGFEEIEFEDKTITRQAADGSITTERVLPLGKVILSNTNDDNNRATWDWGNAIVTESLVAGLTQHLGNFPGGEQRGPLAYYTPTNHDLNSPAITAWGVARGFPRKHNKYSTFVLTVR